jgi:hypothetical protein
MLAEFTFLHSFLSAMLVLRKNLAALSFRMHLLESSTKPIIEYSSKENIGER